MSSFSHVFIFSDVFGCLPCWLHLFTSLFFIVIVVTATATDLKKRFLLWCGFYLILILNIWHNLLLSRLSWGWRFSLKGYRGSHWGSKHRLNPSVCLNRTVFSKRNYMVGSIYVSGAATNYYINDLSLVLDSLNTD